MNKYQVTVTTRKTEIFKIENKDRVLSKEEKQSYLSLWWNNVLKEVEEKFSNPKDKFRYLNKKLSEVNCGFVLEKRAKDMTAEMWQECVDALRSLRVVQEWEKYES